MQILVPGERRFTCITYETLPTKRRAFNWELAHAVLNASSTGLMCIDQIVDELFDRFPERFQGTQSKWQSCRNSLANNMTLSPDFYKAICIPGESRYYWGLTGTLEGVPRPDKAPRHGGSRRPGSNSPARYWKDHGKLAQSLRRVQYQREAEILTFLPLESPTVPGETSVESTIEKFDEAGAIEPQEYGGIRNISEECMLCGQPG